MKIEIIPTESYFNRRQQLQEDDDDSLYEEGSEFLERQWSLNERLQAKLEQKLGFDPHTCYDGSVFLSDTLFSARYLYLEIEHTAIRSLVGDFQSFLSEFAPEYAISVSVEIPPGKFEGYLLILPDRIEIAENVWEASEPIRSLAD